MKEPDRLRQPAPQLLIFFLHATPVGGGVVVDVVSAFVKGEIAPFAAVGVIDGPIRGQGDDEVAPDASQDGVDKGDAGCSAEESPKGSGRVGERAWPPDAAVRGREIILKKSSQSVAM